MVAMRVVEVAFDQIVDMLAMRHGLMATIRTVLVGSVVCSAIVIGRTDIRVAGRNSELMFVHVVRMHEVQAAVVKIIDVAFVLDRGVSATWPVDVGMSFVNSVGLDHSEAPCECRRAGRAVSDPLPRAPGRYGSVR